MLSLFAEVWPDFPQYPVEENACGALESAEELELEREAEFEEEMLEKRAAELAEAEAALAEKVRSVGDRNSALSTREKALHQQAEGLAKEAEELRQMLLSNVNGPLSLDEMETAFDRRWPFGASATITVEQSGGLAPGEHRLEFSQRLRVSYMPFPSINSDAKTLTI